MWEFLELRRQQGFFMTFPTLFWVYLEVPHFQNSHGLDCVRLTWGLGS